MSNGLTLLAHWSVHQKVNRDSSVQLLRSVCTCICHVIKIWNFKMIQNAIATSTTKSRMKYTAVQHEKHKCNNLQTSNVHRILSDINTVISSAVNDSY